MTDPRHNTPERHAEKARIQKMGDHATTAALIVLAALFSYSSLITLYSISLGDLSGKTEGTVVSSFKERAPSATGRGPQRTCKTVASFNVDNTSYKTKPAALCDQEKGKTVQVRYDPENPTDSQIVSGSFGIVGLFFRCIIPFVPLVGWITYVKVWRGRKQRQQ